MSAVREAFDADGTTRERFEPARRKLFRSMPDDDERVPPAAGTPSRDGGESSSTDVAMLGAPTENGVQILRVRDGQMEVGELRAAHEGKPILGESVRLHAREDHPGLYDVETVARGPLARPPQRAPAALPPSRKGPAKVSSDAYRSGWDSIFRGGRGTPGDGDRGGDLPN